jgi:hypothetical protein
MTLVIGAICLLAYASLSVHNTEVAMDWHQNGIETRKRAGAISSEGWMHDVMQPWRYAQSPAKHPLRLLQV